MRQVSGRRRCIFGVKSLPITQPKPNSRADRRPNLRFEIFQFLRDRPPGINPRCHRHPGRARERILPRRHAPRVRLPVVIPR